MTAGVLVVPARLTVGAAARLARRRSAAVVLARLGTGWGGATLATLDRAVGLGVGRIALRAVLWPCPLVAPGTPEIAVRRRLAAGLPLVAVGTAGAVTGAVLAEAGGTAGLPLRAAAQLDRLPAPIPAVLSRAAELAAARGFTVALVGGAVRDLLRGDAGAPRLDLDLVVEGDARRLAADLARALAETGAPARLREHPAFLTATLALPCGLRVDLASARRERYRVAGALPAVEPASLEADLWRRDFSINALAIRLDAQHRGEVLDPTGGLVDLRCRRLRVLHPLAFIEDPTRLFRAVRYGVRLRARLEPASAHLFTEATRLPAPAALSGDRLRAELELARAEPRAGEILTALGRRGAFGLLLPGYRFGAGGSGRVRAAARAAAALDVGPATRERLDLLALTAALTARGRTAWLGRLGFAAPARDELARARREAARLVRHPTAARAFDRAGETGLAWAHATAGSPALRRRIESYRATGRAPLLRGRDLLALGMAPGPAVGRLLERARSAQLRGVIRTRAQARSWAQAVVAGDGGTQRGA
jgi:tRNA nucleotidyltransferase (CCA-adding enzyme)